MHVDLGAFLLESNAIEQITGVRDREFDAAVTFMNKSGITVPDLEVYVSATAGPGASLRTKPGMNVVVGNHRPPDGGLGILTQLNTVLEGAVSYGVTPYDTHELYERLHPFMDGNGRSGRLLWLWQMVKERRDTSRGFLTTWYFQSLERWR